MTVSVLYEYAVTLSSQLIQSTKPYYIMKFESIRELPENELVIALRASQQAQQAIFAIDDMRKAQARGEEEERPPMPESPLIDEVQDVFGTDLSA